MEGGLCLGHALRAVRRARRAVQREAKRAALRPATPLEDRLLLPAEVADRLRVSLRTVRRLVAVGAIRGVRVGTRVRLNESSVRGFLVSRRTRRIA